MAGTMENAEFEAFLTQIRAETPDMNVLKAGMEKFGMGFFSDKQKQELLHTMFPKPIENPKDETEKLGFQELRGIKNTLNAMQQLCADENSPIGNNEMKAFLTMTHPKSGRNVLTTVALNTWAVEKKDKKIRNKGTDEFIARLDKQENIMIDIQNILADVDARTLAEAANTPDESHGVGNEPVRRLTYRGLAAKSPLLMKDNLERMTSEFDKIGKEKPALTIGAASEKEALTIEAESNFKVGGNENKPPLNINPNVPPQEQNTNENPEEKIATLEDAGPENKKGKRGTPDFGLVKEQDIIDYMFQNWFLGGLNLMLEGTYKLADRALDGLCGNYENTPKSSAAATLGGGATRGATGGATGGAASGAAAQGNDQTNAYAAQLDGIANQCAARYINTADNLIGDSAKVAAIVQCIQRHIGQEPDKWTPQFVAGEKGAPKMVFNPKAHIGLIKQLNAIYRKNPQAFKKLMNILLKNPNMVRETLNPKTIGLSSQLATIKYAVKHPEKDLAGDNKAKGKIGKDAFNIMMEITATAAQIREKNEQEYRLRNNKGPNDKLDDKDSKKIQESSTQEMGAYIVGVSEKGKALKDLLIKQQQEQDASKKAILAQQIKQAQKDFDDFYGQYLPKGKEGERGREGEQKPATLPGPVNLTEEARRREQTDRATEQFKSMITEGLSNLAEQQEQNHTRHQNFVMKRNEIQGNGSRSPTMQNFFNNVLGQNKGRN